MSKRGRRHMRNEIHRTIDRFRYEYQNMTYDDVFSVLLAVAADLDAEMDGDSDEVPNDQRHS